MKRYMSLDIGDATIGIAVSDLLGLTAQGVETIRRTELSADLDRLAQLVQEYEPTGFVAGPPKHMSAVPRDGDTRLLRAPVDSCRIACAYRGRCLAQETPQGHR